MTRGETNRLTALLTAMAACLALVASPQIASAAGGEPTASSAATKKKKSKKKRRIPPAPVIPAPALDSPADGTVVMSPGAFTWRPVKGAASYELQVSADAKFGSLVLGGTNSTQPSRTHNTAATLTGTIPDGDYFWRVRAADAGDRVGRWSRVRVLTKRWNAAPTLNSPIDALSVPWPLQPVVLRWSPVPHATSYQVTVAPDPALSNPVTIGSRAGTVVTQGTQYAITSALQAGQYYWAVTPLDADNHPGKRSAVGTFHWSWDSTARNLVVNDLDDRADFSDIQLSWDRVPGAAKYEVEVNSSRDFAVASKRCCDAATIATSVTMRKALPSNDYYWRVRALDALNNGGEWSEGQPFTKLFGNVGPAWVEHADGTRLVDGSEPTGSPVVRWNPVVGAASYEVNVAPFEVYSPTSSTCDWSDIDARSAVDLTANTSWTILGPTPEGQPGGNTNAWPAAQTDNFSPMANALPAANGNRWCARVRARGERDATGEEIVGPWTHVNGENAPAFAFEQTAPPTEDSHFYALPEDLISPAPGAVVRDQPLFRWRQIPGANSYFVVVARDRAFTNVIDVGFTPTTAYAPRASVRPVTYSDETQDTQRPYWWMVIPARESDGGNLGLRMPEADRPSFTYESYQPTQLAPAPGEIVALQPTFRWTAVPGARTYRIQVDDDPAFGGKLIEDFTTAATAYSSDSTLPADAELHWRVRANDETGKGMRWSATRSFVRRLVAPFTATGLAAGGERVPLLAWDLVAGATSYEVHIDETDGDVTTGVVGGTAATPIIFEGTGVWSWKVRARFPTLGQPVAGPWSESRQYVRRIDPPPGAGSKHTSTRTVLSWGSDPSADRYAVEISPNSGFANVIERVTTSSNSYAPVLNPSFYRLGGSYFWRVASMDHGRHLGAWATGSFRVLGALDVRVSGLARVRKLSSLNAIVLDGGRRRLAGATVEMRARGLRRVRKRTDRMGNARFRVRPRYRGSITFRVTKKDYRSSSKVVNAR